MSTKDVGVRIRVEKDLREAFHEACIGENRQASDVLREFMRSFAERYSGGKQISLFASPAKKVRRPSTTDKAPPRKK